MFSFLRQAIGGRGEDRKRSGKAGLRQHANLAIPLMSSHAAQHRDAWRGEKPGVHSLVRSHDGVRCALRLYREQCQYMTSLSAPGARTQPPFRPACVIRTGLWTLLTNPIKSLCNWSAAAASSLHFKTSPKYAIL